ncbi:hypothetical protein [Pseudorhodoferax soli]|uniref:Uncharacterized protein n=1 Tax=Pseudorhodoferax soli TaxID=545864 RepID=A0A368XBQ4_9BURK|nr:hypothetical protein [Pseudorhodoferax soli]RCW65149.1 hypothetical protein DES41_11373 [Pseudorhodoferax soli]
MTALKQARRLIEEQPLSDTAAVVADLVIALELEASFRLERLYALSLADFEMATDLISEWRLARHYAKKGKLLDLAMQMRELGDNMR